MTIRVLDADDGAFLFDSETEKPFEGLSLFSCKDEADNFLAWLGSKHDDLIEVMKRYSLLSGSNRHILGSALSMAQYIWGKRRCAACLDVGCNCSACGRPCSENCKCEPLGVQ